MARSTRTPPHSIEAEMAALGTMMLRRAAVYKVRSLVETKDFYRPVHQHVFDAICRLADRQHEVDLVTLPHELESHGKLEEVGGLEYLIQIAESAPSAHNAAYYADIVKELSMLRQVEDVCIKTYREIIPDPDMEPAQKVAEFRAMAQAVRPKNSGIVDIADIKDGEKRVGIATGFEGLDSIVKGHGLPTGQMTIWAARKKVGKTAGMLQIAMNAADNGHKVLYITMADLEALDIRDRMRHMITGHPEDPVYNLQLSEEYRKKVKAKESVWEFRIVHARDCGSTVEKIVPFVESANIDEGFGLVVVDYAQKVFSDREKDRVRQLERVSSELSAMAGRQQFALLVGSQTNDNGMTRYSQEFEDDCGLLVEVVAPNGSLDPLREFFVKYNRFGPSSYFTGKWNERAVRFEPNE